MVGGLTIGASGCALDVDGPVSPGPVGFSAVNETDVMAAFNIAMLDERATFDRFAAHIREEIRLAQAGKPVLGHPWFAVPLFEVLLQPGQSGTLSGTLDPGRYVLTCARVFEEVGELRPLAALGPLRVG